MAEFVINFLFLNSSFDLFVTKMFRLAETGLTKRSLTELFQSLKTNKILEILRYVEHYYSHFVLSVTFMVFTIAFFQPYL